MRCRGVAKGIVFTLAIFADRLSKAWAMAVLSPLAERNILLNRIPQLCWDGVVRLRYAENTGMAFSMFSGGRWLLIAVTLLLLCGIVLYAWKNRPRGLAAWGITLILAGGVSNVFDRIAYGYVVDMIEPLFVRFAVFNLADTWICVGVGLVLISAFSGGRKGVA